MRGTTLPGIALLIAAPLLLTGIAAVPAAAEPVDDGGSTLTSRLVEAADEGASPARIADELSLPADGGGSLSFDDDGRVTATVMFDAAPDESTLAAVSAVATVDRVLTPFPTATVRVDPTRIPALEAVAGVTSVTPALAPFSGTARDTAALSQQFARTLPSAVTQNPVAQSADLPTRCGPVPIEADAPLHADLARAAYGVDGTGVRIGVISDSFDQDASAPTDWADDVASGALPGPGNPCGHETAVQIVSDARPGSDEGRAMTQLVHGIAPGATLLFADAGSSEIEMALNIQKLAEAGADIIVDDITWPTEAYYQQSFISAAIEVAKRDHDVAYFTSAGNSTSTAMTGPHAGAPVSSWQTTAYRAATCPDWLITGPDDSLADAAGLDCLDFDPDPASEVPFDTLTITDRLIAETAQLQPLASIAEPVFGVTTSYELRFYELDRADDSVELLDSISAFGGPFPGLSGTVEVARGTEVLMVMVRTAHDPAQREPAVYLGFIRGGPAISERAFMGDGVTDWTGESVFGHAGDGTATSVASLDWEDPTQLRDYSSLGPGTMVFEPVSLETPAPAARLPHPVVAASPQIASVDGTQTTFFTPSDGEFRFFGTSAAAPNAAAVAALGASYAPGISGADLTAAVLRTARGTAEGGPVNPYLSFGVEDENVFGAGIVDASRLLASLPAPAPVDFTASRVGPDSIEVTWSEQGAPDHYVISLQEAGGAPRPLVAAASTTAEASQLPAGTTSYAFTGLAPATRYTIRLTAYNAAGEGTPVELAVSTGERPAPSPKPEPGGDTPDAGGGSNGGAHGGGSRLATTGADAWTPLAIGATLLLAGAAAVLASLARRRARLARR